MSDENTLRDALDSALTEQEEIPQIGSTEPQPAQIETQEQKAERLRDEQGRFAKNSAPAPEQKTAAPSPASPVAAAEPVLQRPSSWKKDMWPLWDKLSTGAPLTAEEAKQVAKYNLERESQFASGVSTYREEAVRAKELNEALAPFMQELAQNNISPGQWISNLGNAHMMLTKGSPEQKAALFVQLMNDYQVPLETMFRFDQQGNLGINPDLAHHQQQRPQQDPRQLVKQILEEERMLGEISSMGSNAEKYPHFEAVRATMAGLLQAGLAPDLESAYHKAILHHDDIQQAESQRQAQEAERQRRETESARVAKARANTVSVRGATPAGLMASDGKKGLRDTLDELVTAHMGSGRV